MEAPTPVAASEPLPPTPADSPAPEPVFVPAVSVAASPSQTRPEDEEKPVLVIKKIKLQTPVLVFYQQGNPNSAVQQLLMEEKNLALLKTSTLEQLAERREVFFDGLGNYAPPGTDADKYRLIGVSLLASTEKAKAAPDGRSTYVRLKVPSPGSLYVVQESAESYRHFVNGPQKKGSRIDFGVNVLPGVDSVRAAYTLRKINAAERGAGSGDILSVGTGRP